jgi:hypothetical protein
MGSIIIDQAFYFNPGSLLFFMSNYLALSGVIFAIVIFSLVLISPQVTVAWIITATVLPASALVVLLFAAESIYSRLRDNLGWERDRLAPVKEYLAACLRRGLIGGYLGSLVAALPLCIPYYRQWKMLRAPTESFGQLLLETTFAIAFAACVLGFLCTFFARVRVGRGGLHVLRSASALQTLFGSSVGGVITGVLVAPWVTLYFGRMDRPEVTPGYLLPASVAGASFIVFSIINFDFERLDSRRVWTSACASVISVIAGAFATGVVFGPLYAFGAVEALHFWLEDNQNSIPALLVGGALYGIPVGVVLGIVIGIAVICTEMWSRNAVLT